MIQDSIHVIGTGVGGLSMAALLANQGYSVSIHERSSKLGGKNYLYCLS